MASTPPDVQSMAFYNLALVSSIVRSEQLELIGQVQRALAEKKYEWPMPIQAQSIPAALDWHRKNRGLRATDLEPTGPAQP